MNVPLRVLIVEDSEDDLALLLRELIRGGFEPIHERVETTEEMSEALKRKEWDIVVADYVLPKFSGIQALRVLKESRLDLPFILVSGMIGEETAVEAMRAGAHDYLLKYNFTRLIQVINRELQEAEVRRQRRQADEALRLSEERYRRIVETASEGIWITDANNVTTFVNQRMADMLGYTMREMLGKSMLDFVDEKDRVAALDNLNRHKKGVKEHSDSRLSRKNGSTMWVIISSNPLTDEQGNFLGALGMVTDITKRKKLEGYNETRLALLNGLRSAKAIDECLHLSAKAITEAGLANHAAMVLVNEEGAIDYLGSHALKVKEISKRKGAIISRELMNEIAAKKYQKGRSFLIPTEVAQKLENTPLCITADTVEDDCGPTPNGSKLLLMSMGIGSEKYEGWLLADICPKISDDIDDIIAHIEEIVDMVAIRFREINYFEQLIQERRALQEKNIAMREVLATIESEKMEIRKQIAGMIEDVLRPAANKMLRKNGSINMTYYQLLKANLDELAASTGQVLPMSSKLSPRELEICALIKNGASSKDISDALGIALVTVQKHREVIRKKLSLTNKNINLMTHLRTV
jgi:PAS domain S-box-containing protein